MGRGGQGRAGVREEGRDGGGGREGEGRRDGQEEEKDSRKRRRTADK